jgi:hypothetical protein
VEGHLDHRRLHGNRREIVLSLAASGVRIAAAARSPEKLDGLGPFNLAECLKAEFAGTGVKLSIIRCSSG